jgi:hypothetical protein
MEIRHRRRSEMVQQHFGKSAPPLQALRIGGVRLPPPVDVGPVTPCDFKPQVLFRRLELHTGELR